MYWETDMDYSGHIPESSLRSLPRQFEPTFLREESGSSPIDELIGEMMRKTDEAREKLLRKLLEDPGIVATFNDGFIVEFGDLEFETIDSPRGSWSQRVSHRDHPEMAHPTSRGRRRPSWNSIVARSLRRNTRGLTKSSKRIRNRLWFAYPVWNQ